MLMQRLRDAISEGMRKRAAGESGFTLVELLVVMLILGILAAVAIPAFFNQRNKAHDAQAKAAARTAETAMETYATDNKGSYVGATPAGLQAIEPTLVISGPNAIAITVSNATSTTYTVTSTSSTGEAFTIARNGGTTTFSCAPTGQNGCPASGDWSQ